MFFLIFFAAALLIYSPVLHNGFIHYLDDGAFIANNPYVQKGLTWAGLKWAFAADLPYNSPYVDYWQPMTSLTHLVDGSIWGLAPFGHHLSSLIIHVLNGWLVFRLLKTLTGSHVKSLIVALFFLAHPLQAEMVSWITARKDLMAGFFVLACLWSYTAYLKKSAKLYYLTAVVFFACSLMSKPCFLALPLLLMAFDFYTLKKVSFINKTPFVALAAASLCTVFLARSGDIQILMHNKSISSSLSASIQTDSVNYLRYFWKMLFPANLSVHYPEFHAAYWQAAAALLVLLIFSVYVFTNKLKKPYLLLGWVWALTLLIPAVHLNLSNHYASFSLIGFYVCLVWGHPFKQKTAVVLAVGLLFFYGAASRAETYFWKDGVALFNRSLALGYKNFFVLNQLGLALMQNGQTDEAMQKFCETLAEEPTFAEGHHNLGLCLLKKRQFDEARSRFETSIQLNPHNAAAHNNLGLTLAGLGKDQEAVPEYRKALQIEPRFPEAYVNLSDSLNRLGLKQDALYNLALGFIHSGRTREGQEILDHIQ